MSKLVRQRWEGDFDRGLARRDRRACDYDAYVPDHLVNRPLKLDGDVAADVADAERAITRLNVDASTLVDTEALARILLRAEAVASSRIEGLEVGSRRLLRAEVARELGDESIDVTAAEVLGNIDAMVWAIESVTLDQEISLSHILEIHRRLLVGTRMDEHAGRIRTEQNWIGGSGYNPCAADFVPPPAKMVKGLLNDLCAFATKTPCPPLPKRRSPILSSRRSIHLSTATDVRGEPLSIWSCVEEGWLRACYLRSRSSSPLGLGTTSLAWTGPAIWDARHRRKLTKASIGGSDSLPPPVPEPFETPRVSRSGRPNCKQTGRVGSEMCGLDQQLISW